MPIIVPPDALIHAGVPPRANHRHAHACRSPWQLRFRHGVSELLSSPRRSVGATETAGPAIAAIFGARRIASAGTMAPSFWARDAPYRAGAAAAKRSYAKPCKRCKTSASIEFVYRSEILTPNS